MTTLTSKAVTTVYPRVLPDLLRVIPLANACCNTLINPATATCINCGKDGHFALSCPKLKDMGDIKEIEEEEISDKLGKEES